MEDNFICLTCGGYGFEDRVCEECGKAMNTKIELDDDPEIDTKVKHALIPDEYSKRVFDAGKLFASHPELEKDKMFAKYAQQLGRIVDIFRAGQLPQSSGIIIALPQMGKELMAYTCMKFALANNFTVAPMIDTLDMKRLFVVSSTNPYYKLYNKIDYDSYISADVLFCSVTKTDYCVEAYRMVQEILTKRSRLGLCTFITSDFSLEVISKRDYNTGFVKNIKRKGAENSLKYPNIIQYLGGM